MFLNMTFTITERTQSCKKLIQILLYVVLTCFLKMMRRTIDIAAGSSAPSWVCFIIFVKSKLFCLKMHLQCFRCLSALASLGECHKMFLFEVKTYLLSTIRLRFNWIHIYGCSRSLVKTPWSQTRSLGQTPWSSIYLIC